MTYFSEVEFEDNRFGSNPKIGDGFYGLYLGEVKQMGVISGVRKDNMNRMIVRVVLEEQYLPYFMKRFGNFFVPITKKKNHPATKIFQ